MLKSILEGLANMSKRSKTRHPQQQQKQQERQQAPPQQQAQHDATSQTQPKAEEKKESETPSEPPLMVKAKSGGTNRVSIPVTSAKPETQATSSTASTKEPEEKKSSILIPGKTEKSINDSGFAPGTYYGGGGRTRSGGHAPYAGTGYSYTYSSGPEKPKLVFANEAWHKLRYICRKAPTEIAGFGVSSVEDLLSVKEFHLLNQEASVAYVEIDDDAMAEFIDEQYAKFGRQPVETGRIWIHTHPSGSASPSGTDWRTFNKTFADCDWSVMMILSKSDDVTCHMQMRVGGMVSQFKIEVENEDYHYPVSVTNVWDAEFAATRKNVVVRSSTTSSRTPIGFHSGTTSRHPALEPSGTPAPRWRGDGYDFSGYSWASVDDLDSMDDFSISQSDVMAMESEDDTVVAAEPFDTTEDMKWEKLKDDFVKSGGDDLWANDYQLLTWENYSEFYEFVRDQGEDPNSFPQMTKLDHVAMCLDMGENIETVSNR